MGLRCLLGHDFGDPEIEREREEEGEEMVVTVREVKTCARCGETQIISENKEVTSIRPAPSTEPDPVETDDALADVHRDVGEWGDADSSSFEETTAGDDSSFGDDDFEPPQSAEEDDGIILDDEGEDEPTERQPGEWPDSGDVGREPDRMPTLEEVEGQLDADAPAESDAGAAAESESSPWPEQQGEDEGFAAELHEDDEGVDVDFGNKLAPELGDDTTEEGYDAEFIGNASDEATVQNAGSSGGFVRTKTLSREDAADLQTEYYCPACEMTRPADESSMRAGDICPECKHGYITERER